MTVAPATRQGTATTVLIEAARFAAWLEDQMRRARVTVDDRHGSWPEPVPV